MKPWERQNLARNAKPGDAWERRKDGKLITVIENDGWGNLTIRHGAGKITKKHYRDLSYEYDPLDESGNIRP